MDISLKIFENQVILITGGGGYLGSKLAEVLAKSDSRIILLDIDFNQISKSLASSYKNVELLRLDLKDRFHLTQACQELQPDYIFHFAALLDRTHDFEVYGKLYEVNVTGTYNLLESSKDIDYKGFYLASTSEIYGNKNELPFSEEQSPFPTSPYSLTKSMAENLCKTFCTLNSKPYTILRIFNYFGPGMPEATFIGQMLASLKKNKIFIMTQGLQKRDLIYIDDMIDEVLYIASATSKVYDTYNVCKGTSYRMIDVANIFSEVTNHEFKFETSLAYRSNEIWDMFGSTRRILELGYRHTDSALKDNLNKIIN
jgi:nucleoside-diphosphate-sugar epimerase